MTASAAGRSLAGCSTAPLQSRATLLSAAQHFLGKERVAFAAPGQGRGQFVREQAAEKPLPSSRTASGETW